MNEMMIFTNPEFGEIGIIEIGGKPYFPAVDCARILGYANPRDAVKRHTKGVVKHDVLTSGGIQEVNFISEGNLYRLIGHSKLPAAEAFESWVFDQIVPSVVRHGLYMTEKAALEALETPEEFLARALIVAQETLRKRDERLASLEAEYTALAASSKGMEIQLDKSGDYFSIKRVAAMNGIPWTDINWRKLKAESKKGGRDVQKVFASDYGNVNAYHIDVWKRVYPDLEYGDVADDSAVLISGQEITPPALKAERLESKPKQRRLEIYQIADDGTRLEKPLIISLNSGSNPDGLIRRIKELNPHWRFEAEITEV